MHIEAGHVDSNWPEFTFVFTYISCLNRLALSAISLKTNSLSYLILFIISLVGCLRWRFLVFPYWFFLGNFN